MADHFANSSSRVSVNKLTRAKNKPARKNWKDRYKPSMRKHRKDYLTWYFLMSFPNSRS